MYYFFIVKKTKEKGLLLFKPFFLTLQKINLSKCCSSIENYLFTFNMSIELQYLCLLNFYTIIFNVNDLLNF